MQRAGELSARRSKENQAKILGLLCFIWPNRAFSKGYERKNKKIAAPFGSRVRL
jgi:hypothetical protein